MSTPLPTPTTSLTETKGDLFASPDYSVLVHACNCQGTWGKGIAKRFRELYPTAYSIYRSHCLASLATTSPTTTNKDAQPRPLLGTALLIPPQKGDSPRQHWIGCLFTRWHYRGRVDVQEVLEETRGAVRDLERLLEEVREGAAKVGEDGNGEARDGETGVGDMGARIGEVVACRVNAGCFGVEWGETRRVLGEEGVGWRVVEFDEGDGEGGGKGRGRGGRKGGERVREERERGKREEGLERVVGREGDRLREEKARRDPEAGADAALRGVNPVPGSTRAVRGGHVHEEGKVDGRHGKRRRLE